jgi:RecQ family ATP-dependent DNA helicase
MSDIISLKARERSKGDLVKFYQTIALPKELLDLNNNLNFGNLRFINQWRIDYPKNLVEEVSKENKTILSIIHKILTRGEYTTISHLLAEKFSSKFTNKGNFNSRAYDFNNTSNKSNFLFDSNNEKRFFEGVLPTLLGNSFKKYVIPQVEFHSMLYNYDFKSESKESKERVDFLITSNKSKVIVELDGEEHEKQKSKDYSRTKRLIENGYKEIRIKNSELDNLDCKGIQELRKEFENLDLTEYKKTEYDKYLNSLKIAHQFQITLVELLFEGVINTSNKNKIAYDYSLFNEYSKSDIKFILEESLKDLKEVISKLSKLYSVTYLVEKIELVENITCSILLTYNENIESTAPLCIIQDISFPKIISNELKSVENLCITTEPNNSDLNYFLEYIFGFNTFRDGQYESLKRILLNKDTITLLPTGAGKSIIFQLATLLLPGISLIIVPIKSLMQDQVENLERKGISRAVSLSSDIESRNEKDKIQKLIYEGHYLFVYIAPERFLINDFRNSLREFTKKYIISLIVIDEAHCVSEWGHDFRPAYLTVGKNSRIYCQNKDGFTPPLIALTGTASENVLIDVKEDLEVKDEDAVISSETFDRKELHFNIIKCESDEKYLNVKKIITEELPKKLGSESIFNLDGKSTKSGIIFCPFTTNKESNPRGVEFFVAKIKEDFGDICKPYYASENERNVNARNFQENRFPLLIATKGYGMGIDKSNIRYVIHINLPPSVEAFYQEAGRAGRDRSDSESFIIYSCTKDEKNTLLLNLNTPLDEIKKACNQIGKWDDIRSLFHFHNSTFKGKKEELQIIKGILDEIGDLDKEYQPYYSKFNNIKDEKSDEDESLISKQKAIFRLTAIGVITNYGVDYASKEFSLKIDKIKKDKIINYYYNYVKKYNQLRAKIEKQKLEDKKELGTKEFILYCCELFLDYVYDYYEKGRRQALSTMLSILEKSISNENPDKIFREEISNFLKRTYSKQLRNIANSKDLTRMLIQIQELIGGSDTTDSLIKPVSDLKSLYSQISRTLEDYPESIGLFLLRAYIRIRINEGDNNLVIKDTNQFLILSFNKYRLEKSKIYPLLSWLLLEIVKVKPERGFYIIKEVLAKIDDEDLTIMLINSFKKENLNLDYGKIILLKKIYKTLEDDIYGGEQYG